MIPAILDFDNYRSYEGETAPTTYAQMQTYMSNQNKIIKAIVATHLWQPATTYIVGQVVYSNSMTLNTCARCIVAGTSAENDEPTWGTVIGAHITDNGVTWEIIATSADAWIPGQSVTLGKTIRPLSIANGCVACCTTAGTTSSTTVPTWTSVSMGGTITDGTVVWTIMANEYVYAEGTGFIVRQHYNPNTGAWIKNIDEWGIGNSVYGAWTATQFPLAFSNSYVGSVCPIGEINSTYGAIFTNLATLNVQSTIAFSFKYSVHGC